MIIKKLNSGFTLIELMITVAVIGILASIAFPSYTEQVARGRRTEAQTIVLSGQQWMERFYSENFRYDQNSAGTLVTDSTQFPSRFNTSPAAGQGVAAMYNISASAPTRDSYSITAARTGNMANDKCGDMVVDNLGRRSLNNYNSTKFSTLTAAISYCWK